MKAFRPLEHDKLLKAGNTLTQRSFRTPHNEVTVRIDISQMADGQHAGLCHLASHSGSLGVTRSGGTTRLELRHDDTRRAQGQNPTLTRRAQGQGGTRRAPGQDSTQTRRALGFMRLGLLFGEKFPSVFNIDALLRVCLNCAALEVVSG